MHHLLYSPDYWMGVASVIVLLAAATLFLIVAIRLDPNAHARQIAADAEFEAAVERERHRIRTAGLSARQLQVARQRAAGLERAETAKPGWWRRLGTGA